MTNKTDKIGLLSLTALVSGNMIGSGVFLLPASLAALGTVSLYSWVLTSFGALLLASIFAVLSLHKPLTGGPAAYVRHGLGKFLGFQTALVYWTSIWIGNAAVVVAMLSYLHVFLPSLHNRYLTFAIGMGILWSLTAINIRGVREASIVQIVTMILKLIPLLLLIFYGWSFIHMHYYHQGFNISHPHQSNWRVLLQGATLTLWAFIGLESATVPADSVRNPHVTIPLATFLGTLLASAVYITSSIVIMGMIPASILQHSSAPFADAAAIMLGPWGRDFIAAGAIISCLGSLNGWILLHGQVPMAAALDGLFPKFWAKRNKKGTPVRAILSSTILVSILLLLTLSQNLLQQFHFIILLATFAALIPYLYVSIASFPIFKPMLTRRMRYIMNVCASMAIIFAFVAILSTGVNIYYGLIFLLLSIPLFFLWKARMKK